MLNEKDSTRVSELGSWMWSRNKYSSELFATVTVTVTVSVSWNVSVSPAGISRYLLLSSYHVTDKESVRSYLSMTARSNPC